MRGRAFRRHQAIRHMRRRVTEDRNQHYNALDCPCWYDLKVIGRFKEQPKHDCNHPACHNQRAFEGAKLQERKQWLRLRDAGFSKAYWER